MHFVQINKFCYHLTLFIELMLSMYEKKTLLKKLLQLLEDIQAIDVTVIDVRQQTAITDL